jgi:hypothetical protein
MQLRRFLTVLEYSLIGEKFPPITTQYTLYTEKKKIKTELHQSMDWLAI